MDSGGLASGLVPLSEVREDLARFARGIPLRNRRGEIVAFAMVDAEDYGRLSRHRWFLNNNGYAARNETIAGKRRTVLMHRVLLGLEHGDSCKTDHINRDTLDNRRPNLRRCTHQQNHQNRSASGNRGSSSRYRGVSWNKKGRYWSAYVCVDGRVQLLGQFDDEDEAGRVSAEARRALMPFSLN